MMVFEANKKIQYSSFSLICTAHLYVLVRVSLQSTDFRLYVLVSGGEAAPKISLICTGLAGLQPKMRAKGAIFFDAP